MLSFEYDFRLKTAFIMDLNVIQEAIFFLCFKLL